MRDPSRIPKILEEIGKIWNKYPDMRLGQFLINATMVKPGVMTDFYYMEDDHLIEILNDLYK